MGLFGSLGKSNKKVGAPVGAGGISLEKSVISLDKTLISLEKESGISLTKHCAKVGLVLDYSGSMNALYREGKVQDMLTRLMPIALKFDDNGELDTWLFTDGYKRMKEPVVSDNYEDYVEQVIRKSGFSMGCTEYAPVLKDVLKKYFNEDKATSDIPTFLIFVTDGDNSDKAETNKVVKEAAEKNIFIQFVGIGNASFEYLEQLDDLKGRAVDNTGFIKVTDMQKLPDDQLYTKLLEQYPEWLKAKGLK